MAAQKLLGRRSHGRTPPGTPTIKERWIAAKATGAQAFDPGVECVNGHAALRWTNNGICIDCKRARDNAYNADHKAEHRARSRKSVLARVDEVRAYQTLYYLANAEKGKARTRTWAKGNPDRVRVQQANRRALVAGIGDRAAYAAFVRHVMAAPSIRCYWCKARTSIGERHRDHIVPLSKGGADAVGNLCVSCPACNRRKSAKLPEDFSGQSELRLA